MQFLLVAFLFLVFDGVILWYLTGSEYFSPSTITGDVDVFNIASFVALIVIGAGLLVSILMYLGEKFLYCGRREFPPTGRAVRSGLVAAIMLAILLVLHIFHFLNFVLGLVIAVLVVIGIIIIR